MWNTRGAVRGRVSIVGQRDWVPTMGREVRELVVRTDPVYREAEIQTTGEGVL